MIQRYEGQCNEEVEHFKPIIKADDGDYVLYSDHRAAQEEADIAWKSELKKQFEAGIAIIHDQGAENILLKEQIAALTAVKERQGNFIDKVEMAYPEFYEYHREALRGEEQ